jgi:pimeloyl-ACP methyl ester carboxylesterase
MSPAPAACPRRRLVLLGLLGLLLGLGIALRAEIAAQARVVGVLSAVLEPPVLTPALETLTGDPIARERTLAGLAATEVRPAGEGPWPAVLFVNGATPDGRRNPQVRRLADGLARTGHIVIVPDLPGLAEGEISGRTLDAVLAAARATSGHPDAEAGRAALVGVSVGASLALVAAAEGPLAQRVTVVSGVAPYADLETVLSVATTGTYRSKGRLRAFEPEPFVRAVVARSLVAALPPGPDRTALGVAVDRVAGGGGLSPVDLAGLVALGPDGRAVAALLLNRDPERFDALYAALPPGVRTNLERLSPIEEAAALEAPVELASAPRDKYFPLEESRRLARRAPRARLTVTRALRHADAAPSLRELDDLVALNSFVRRTLLLARRGAEGGRR